MDTEILDLDEAAMEDSTEAEMMHMQEASVSNEPSNDVASEDSPLEVEPSPTPHIPPSEEESQSTDQHIEVTDDAKTSQDEPPSSAKPQIDLVRDTIEADHVFLLMTSEYRVSRNVRAHWYFQRLNTI